MANKIVPCTLDRQQKSVSIDKVLFDLFLSYHDNDHKQTLITVRQYIVKHWGKPKLSKLVQHEILRIVCKPHLVADAFKTDEYPQTGEPFSNKLIEEKS
jgi:hypothetical protein